MLVTDFIFHQNYWWPKNPVCYALPLSGFFSSWYSQHAATFGVSSVYHVTVSLIFLIYTVYFIIAAELLSNTASWENTYSIKRHTDKHVERKTCRNLNLWAHMQTCPHSSRLVADTRPLLDIVFHPTDCAHTSDHRTETLVPATGNESVKHQ